MYYITNLYQKLLLDLYQLKLIILTFSESFNIDMYDSLNRDGNNLIAYNKLASEN